MTEGATRTAAPPPGVDGVVTFFYYRDLPRALAFYEQALGLRRIQVGEWCGLFELRPGALLGLVAAAAGSQAPIEGRGKGAILSLETDGLEDWLARLKSQGLVASDAVLERGGGGRTWEFKVYDPEGYCLEFFRWIDRPEGA